VLQNAWMPLSGKQGQYHVIKEHICVILFLFLGFATCFGGGDGSRGGAGAGVGMGLIVSSSRSMLSRAESRSLCATTVDVPLDDEELEYGLGDKISMISSSDSLMYSELLYVWDLWRW
jgi:hypothetical protein